MDVAASRAVDERLGRTGWISWTRPISVLPSVLHTYICRLVRSTEANSVQPLLGTRSDANNNSVVLAVSVGGIRILLTGDAESEQQHTLLAGAPLRADVLKVSHHGSAFQEPAFLDAVAPRVALVSVGRQDRRPRPLVRRGGR